MWYLKRLKKCLPEEEEYHILEGTIHAVGRKDTQILIDDDPSISRRHCILKVVHPPENLPLPEQPAILKAVDASKYGTFKNSVRLEKGVEVNLNDGDILKFGQFQSEFKVCYEPLIITTSCLDDTNKEIVRKAVQTLGGHIVSEWKPCCTHLVMSDIKVTVKALCCLISLKPITSPAFLTDLVNSYKSRSAAPSFENYLPPPNEPLLDKQRASFCIMPSRRTIFYPKTFVFLENEQMKKLKSIIRYGGGDCILSDVNNPVDINLISQIGYCVVQPPNVAKLGGDNLSIYIKKVAAILRRKKKRMISEQEIGLSVVYCSTEEYCNPDAKINDSTQQKQPPILSQSCAQEIYAYDTEELASRNKRASMATDEISTRTKVQSEASLGPASTIEQSLEDVRGSKRMHSEESSINAREDEFQQSMKRLKLENANNKTLPLSGEGKKISRSQVEEYDTRETVQKKCILNNDDAMDIMDCPVGVSDPEVIGKRNENKLSSAEAQSQQLKNISKRVLGIQKNGFRSIPKNKKSMDITKQSNPVLESLPRNLMKISIVDLVNKGESSIKTVANTSCGKNFKKFKKSFHPRSSAKEVTNFIEHNCQKVMNFIGNERKLGSPLCDSPDDRGEFDWSSFE